MPFEELIALYVEAKTGSPDAVQWLPDGTKDAADDLIFRLNDYLRGMKLPERA